eukprot:CAMPEP_0184494646 /NCGR_PEP_ID=MMETSP0113_2-20130426/29274_1 /TAXON_ID=91329 /ORGANISM="Norrisiella sphaerica, Strain BC52" /LENGTH=71 /DNA_ID=CAMNT_0026880493 /DNA_START=520 /DNA_END=735 /DNA_ORIENTATION=+
MQAASSLCPSRIENQLVNGSLYDNVRRNGEESTEREWDMNSEVPILIVDPWVSNVERGRSKEANVVQECQA